MVAWETTTGHTHTIPNVSIVDDMLALQCHVQVSGNLLPEDSVQKILSMSGPEKGIQQEI